VPAGKDEHGVVTKRAHVTDGTDVAAPAAKRARAEANRPDDEDDALFSA
jgi:hypothetical protein